ncbi:unnamed protein product [Amoebophrya sp. A25]|nr:unnamed protein product [Amoebophrya sp. A25]|eukprot:GSA25T00007965001.1
MSHPASLVMDKLSNIVPAFRNLFILLANYRQGIAAGDGSALQNLGSKRLQYMSRHNLNNFAATEVDSVAQQQFFQSTGRSPPPRNMQEEQEAFGDYFGEDDGFRKGPGRATDDEISGSEDSPTSSSDSEALLGVPKNKKHSKTTTGKGKANTGEGNASKKTTASSSKDGNPPPTDEDEKDFNEFIEELKFEHELSQEVEGEVAKVKMAEEKYRNALKIPKPTDNLTLHASEDLFDIIAPKTTAETSNYDHMNDKQADVMNNLIPKKNSPSAPVRTPPVTRLCNSQGDGAKPKFTLSYLGKHKGLLSILSLILL